MKSGSRKKGAFVVTGAGRGLGRQLVSEAYRRGYPVALISRTASELEEAVAEARRAHPEGESRMSIHPGDLTDAGRVEEIFEEIRGEHGSVEVLVNNAATWTGGKSVLEASAESMQRSLDLNFFSAFHATKAVLEGWRKDGNKEPLAIVNVGATASLRGGKNMSLFAVAKSALRILSQSLSKELAPEGVHVAHVIIDGLIANERTIRINPGRPRESFLGMESICEGVFYLVNQSRDCWTFELDMRPYNESWT